MDHVRDYKRIADVLEKINPDVVAIQEVDSMTHRTDRTYSLGEIADHMRYYASFAPAISFDGGKYGIGILSRKRPISVERCALPGREEGRTLLVAEFDDYVFAATHLSLTEADRMASLKMLEDRARKYDKPFIVAGDFNDEPVRRSFGNWSVLSSYAAARTNHGLPTNPQRVWTISPSTKVRGMCAARDLL